MKYEIRIFAKDRTKIINFGEEEGDWEDLYHSAGLVVDGEPDQKTEENLLIGTIHTDLLYEEVIRIIIEDAGLIRPVIEELVKNEEEKIFFNETKVKKNNLKFTSY